MSLVLFRYFRCFGLLCHRCSSLHKTKSRQHTRVSTVFNSEAVCVQKIHPIGNFFRPQLRLYDPCTRTNVSFSKILTHYAENEHFPPPIPRSLLSAAPCDIVIGHGRERGLGQGQISRYPGWYSQLMYITNPNPWVNYRLAPLWSIVLFVVSLSPFADLRSF